MMYTAEDELHKLTGSDDDTLGEFLMSLHSAAEVQEYVMDYSEYMTVTSKTKLWIILQPIGRVYVVCHP